MLRDACRARSNAHLNPRHPSVQPARLTPYPDKSCTAQTDACLLRHQMRYFGNRFITLAGDYLLVHFLEASVDGIAGLSARCNGYPLGHRAFGAKRLALAKTVDWS